MHSRSLAMLLAIAGVASMSQMAGGADYRGMATGWPVYSNGYNAAGYAAPPAGNPAYYVARPVSAQIAQPGRTGVMYVPTRAAYANPSYYAAYGRSPVAYQPVTAGYAPAAAYYAPAAAPAYYTPVTANYAPANSYAVTPAGLSSAGSEAAAYYGQPTALNYVPPRYTYRTAYAQVPVYMYRPVTTYNPITAQPVTCLQPTTVSTCQAQRQRCSSFSWLNPFTWFNHSSCAAPRCGSVPPTTSYCGTAASQCGQPYYPIQPVTPVIPVVPAPATTLPPNTIPSFPRGSTVIPQAGPTVPPPPTVPFGTRGTVTTPGLAPADLQPRLPAGTAVPAPGSTFAPGGAIITPIPSNPAPGGTFGAPPATTVPPSSFPTAPAQPSIGFGTGSFGTGTNYPPAVDPYSPALTPASNATSASGSAGAAPPTSAMPPAADKNGPPHSVFGSGFRPAPAQSHNSNVIRAPELRPAMPPNVQTVPDLDATLPPRPANSAPQLLNPRDKTASAASRWAVVPALWPQHPVKHTSSTHLVQTSNVKQVPAATQPVSDGYDDGGWRSGR